MRLGYPDFQAGLKKKSDKNINFLKTSDSMLGSGEASGKECVKNCVQNVKLRIFWET